MDNTCDNPFTSNSSITPTAIDSFNQTYMNNVTDDVTNNRTISMLKNVGYEIVTSSTILYSSTNSTDIGNSTVQSLAGR